MTPRNPQSNNFISKYTRFRRKLKVAKAMREQRLFTIETFLRSRDILATIQTHIEIAGIPFAKQQLKQYGLCENDIDRVIEAAKKA
jgi:hypothetical protein